MSDFHPKSFKWTEILSLIIENYKKNDRFCTLKEDLDQLRQYATKKYKANPEIEQRFKEYYKEPEEIFGILVEMFGEP